MPEEREGRTKLHDDINDNGGSGLSDYDPLDNCPINLLNADHDEITECKIKSKEELLGEYHDWAEENRSETSSMWRRRITTTPVDQKL